MNLEEAKAWLQGLRSLTNSITCEPMETWQARIAEADAAMMQQAYWILKAHKEGLLNENYRKSFEKWVEDYYALHYEPSVTEEDCRAASAAGVQYVLDEINKIYPTKE